MRSSMPSQFSFSQVPTADIPRSNFRRSHTLKTGFASGYIVPIYVDEVLPGDTFNCRSSFFCRLATPLVAPMDNLYLDVFFFFTPNRLVWANWQKFCGEQLDPGDSISYLVPQVTVPAGGFAESSIYDYMGIPPGPGTGRAGKLVNALHLRAYNKIWNEWFRDENLQNRAANNTLDGPDVATDYVLKKRGKRHDYFTSCLPWPIKFTAPNVPLGSTAKVVQDASTVINVFANGGSQQFQTTAGTPATVQLTSGLAQTFRFPRSATTGVSDGFDSHLVADLALAVGPTVNSLRQAFQIQRLQERDARGGTRYREILLSHFGVNSPDARLQRPEYLGGGTVPLLYNPVAQTSATVAGQTPIGKVGSFGVGGGSGIGFTKSFVEHGTLLGLACVRADINYQQGLHVMWSRRSRFDFYWPALAHLGEQSVLNKEIYWDGAANDDSVFGYQERWAEYRYKPGQITGILRSTATGTLDTWHLAQKFTALPALNATFIEEAPPLARVNAVSGDTEILMDAFFDIQTARPMPTYSVPGMMDRF